MRFYTNRNHTHFRSDKRNVKLILLMRAMIRVIDHNVKLRAELCSLRDHLALSDCIPCRQVVGKKSFGKHLPEGPLFHWSALTWAALRNSESNCSLDFLENLTDIQSLSCRIDQFRRRPRPALGPIPRLGGSGSGCGFVSVSPRPKPRAGASAYGPIYGKQYSLPSNALPHVPRMAERIAAGLRPHRQAVRLFADRNFLDRTRCRIDVVNDIVVAAGQP